MQGTLLSPGRDVVKGVRRGRRQAVKRGVDVAQTVGAGLLIEQGYYAGKAGAPAEVPPTTARLLHHWPGTRWCNW